MRIRATRLAELNRESISLSRRPLAGWEHGDTGTGHGSVEAERFLQLMRRLEAFSGMVILNYALMANHFHLLCEVPEPRTLSEAELLQRVEAGFGPARREALEQQLARWRQQPDGLDQIQRLLEPYRRRMNDISIFIKELKGSFAQWFNRRHRRYGALWAERFKSVLLEGGEALAALSAYIDLNPVRAGLCADPKDYLVSGSFATLESDSAAEIIPVSANQANLPPRYRVFREVSIGSSFSSPLRNSCEFDFASNRSMRSIAAL